MMSTAGLSSERWSQLAGPDALGRSLLLDSGSPVPPPWSSSARVVLDDQSLLSPRTLEIVREAYLTRQRLVIEFTAGMDRPPFGVNLDDVWDVAPNFDFVAETTWRLALMNSVDARGALEATFPLVARASALGATVADDATADVRLADGTLAWCDGGPLYLWEDHDTRVGGRAVIPRLAIRQGALSPIRNSEVTADLAPDQLAAVGDPSIRARIIAPAGSGKTRVLTERVRHLVRSGVPTGAMVMMAYNKRAEEEMRARTGDLAHLEIRTIDSLVLAIVNGTRGYLASDDPRRLISESEVRGVISHLVTFPRRANVDPLGPWLSALTQARLGLQSPDDVEAAYGGDVDGFAQFYPLFRSHLRENGLADFNEIVLLAVERLLREPRTRLAAERRTEVMLVDEFQDLTPAHMLLLRLLAGPTLSIFGVGDDDQTIYGFNGASPEWLVDFNDHVPHAVHHALEVNYRCPAPVVAATTYLLSRNRFRVRKHTRPGPLNVQEADSLVVVTTPDQATVVVDRVQALLAGGARTSDITVLTRVNVGLLAPLVALQMAGIPVNLRDGENLLSGSGIDAALAWLRLATNPASFASGDLLLAARRPGRGIHPEIMKWLGKQRSLDQLQSMHAQLQEPAATKVGDFLRDLQRLDTEVTTGTTTSVLEHLNGRIGLGAVLASLDEGRPAGVKAANSDGLRSLLALARLHPEARTFEARVRQMLSMTQDVGGVALSSVHKVKGLEWPHVIVYDASEDVFPHRLSHDLEEERRVFHVAITRCQQSLLITTDPAGPSIFLSELAAPTTESAGPGRSTTSRTSQAPSRARTSRSRGRPSTRPASTPPPLEATVGLRFRWSGYDCLVDEVTPLGAVITLGAHQVTVEFGERVTVMGNYRTLADEGSTVSGPAGEPLRRGTSGASEGLREALKQWRREQAVAEGVPAYVVFYDTTLDELCATLPRTTTELRRVRGFGPVKVEKYADAVLALISENLL